MELNSIRKAASIPPFVDACRHTLIYILDSRQAAFFCHGCPQVQHLVKFVYQLGYIYDKQWHTIFLHIAGIFEKFQHIVEMIHPVLLVIKIMRDQRPHISGSCFPTVIPVMISPRNAIIHVNLRMIEKHFHRFFQKQMSVKPIVIHRKTIYTIFFCDFALPLQSLHI